MGAVLSRWFGHVFLEFTSCDGDDNTVVSGVRCDYVMVRSGTLKGEQ